jgi:hypothetical protein
MPTVGRTGCRLPIDEQSAALIATQKQRTRERYPDTPVGELRLVPQAACNPRGTRPMTPMDLSRFMRGWGRRAARLIDSDGQPFERAQVVPTRSGTATRSATPTTARR